LHAANSQLRNLRTAANKDMDMDSFDLLGTDKRYAANGPMVVNIQSSAVGRQSDSASRDKEQRRELQTDANNRPTSVSVDCAKQFTEPSRVSDTRSPTNNRRLRHSP
jgi:hypothetical protein